MLAYTYIEKGKFELIEKGYVNNCTDIEKAYELFENRRDHVIKVAIRN